MAHFRYFSFDHVKSAARILFSRFGRRWLIREIFAKNQGFFKILLIFTILHDFSPILCKNFVKFREYLRFLVYFDRKFVNFFKCHRFSRDLYSIFWVFFEDNFQKNLKHQDLRGKLSFPGSLLTAPLDQFIEPKHVSRTIWLYMVLKWTETDFRPAMFFFDRLQYFPTTLWFGEK